MIKATTVTAIINNIKPSRVMVELLRAIGRGEFVGKENQITSAQSLIEHGATSAE
jgi:hypothetical protein